ncbi:hypothetical protein niasHS_013484 [Heterodera schachtii]|uniref:KANSL3 helical domain-containing protein n=1 Tax=Heterodera schachtii TaxID=97005 RepID=A0ABD2IKG4_HETSC
MEFFLGDFESDEDEVDEISQVLLHEQISQMQTEDFFLPAHIKFTTDAFEEENNDFLSAADFPDDYHYFDNFSDEQEEIKLMESPMLVEIPDEMDTPSHSFDYSIKLSGNEIEILDRIPVISKPGPTKSVHALHRPVAENENLLPGAQQKKQRQQIEKTQRPSLAMDSADMKRRRRPTMNADDFVYTPLKKVRLTVRKMEENVVVKREEETLVAKKEKKPKERSEKPKEIREKPKEMKEKQRERSEKPKEVKEKPKEMKEKPKEMREKPKEMKEKEFQGIEMTKKTAETVAAKKETKPKELNEMQLQRLNLIKKIKEKKAAAKEKRERERNEKQMQRLEFIRRMTELRHLNPLASPSRGPFLYEGDYFYREILVGRPDSNANNDEAEVDCVSVSAPGGFDELFVTNPAENSAISISKMICGRKKALNNKEEDGGTYSEESFKNLGVEAREFLGSFLKFIDDQRLVDLATQGVTGGASMFHSLTMKNANCLRESLRLYCKSGQALLVQVHFWLLKHLSQTRLTSYLNLLRFLKNAGSNLSDYIASSPTAEAELEKANKTISEFIAQKLYEPPLSSSSKFIECDPIKNVSLVLVYPQINAKMSQHTIRAHETLFRNLLPLAVCCVEKVELNLNVDRPISVEECAWMCIRMIRQRVKEIAKRRQNDHIFLAGWGTTCWLNHKAVSKVSNVSGILDFAFPTESPCGSRGSVDDQICLTYPSTLFVVGEDAHNVRMQALRQLRKNMIADSGLVVIGNANHNLLVSPTILSIERISQFIVQKNIVENVMQFIKQVVADLGPPKECRQFLKPIKLPNIYEVDPAFFKAKPATGPNRQRKPTEKKEKEENGDKDRPKKERKIAEPPQRVPFRHPTQIALNLPSQLQPAIPATLKYGVHLNSARHSFSTSLKSVSVDSEPRVSDQLKIPSPETLNRQLPPLLHGIRLPMPAAASSSSSNAFQETLREEEEAAAALASLK